MLFPSNFLVVAKLLPNDIHVSPFFYWQFAIDNLHLEQSVKLVRWKSWVCKRNIHWCFSLQKSVFMDLAYLEAKFCEVFSRLDRCCRAAALAHFLGLLFSGCIWWQSSGFLPLWEVFLGRCDVFYSWRTMGHLLKLAALLTETFGWFLIL